MKTSLRIFLLAVVSIMLISGTIDLDNFLNYENQTVPSYITKDNTPLDNPITDKGATLGRVLFYDKKLSTNNTVSCATCHQQEFGFSDRDQFSEGVNGQTLRHSTRLINSRFGEEQKFFWDERASTLEVQATIPIKDHNEMGFSGENGDPDFQVLINKLSATAYYPELFNTAFGDVSITEERIGKALAQFVRSIQSFDSKYDVGLAQVSSPLDDFPNFTADENAGKRLFTEDFEYVIEEVTIEKFGGDLVTTAAHRVSGGLNCANCHRAPEFDIDPVSLNNGFDRPLNGNSLQDREFTVTRSPSLRDLINPSGELNSPMFHAGTTNNLIGGIMANYNFKDIHPDNNNLDPRFVPEGYPQFLDITNVEKDQLVAFLGTLTGNDVYTNEKWSDPFDENGDITVIGGSLSVSKLQSKEKFIKIYPNPVLDKFTINGTLNAYHLKLLNTSGQVYQTIKPNSDIFTVDISTLSSGVYFIEVLDANNSLLEVQRIIKK